MGLWRGHAMKRSSVEISKISNDRWNSIQLKLLSLCIMSACIRVQLKTVSLMKNHCTCLQQFK